MTRADAQAGIRRNAARIAGGVSGASIIALLAVSSVMAPALVGGVTWATALAWLGGLGSNALATWLTTWAEAQVDRFDGLDPDRAQHLLEHLARDLTGQLAQNAAIAADVGKLLAATDAVAVALDALRGRADQQARLLQQVLAEVQQAAQQNVGLHATTLRAVETGTQHILAAQGQDNTTIAALLHDILAAVARLETGSPATVQVTGDAGMVQALSITGGQVGKVVAHETTYVIQPAAVPPTDLAAAQARLRELPLDTIPDAAPLPPGSRMPFARNPHFVGRAEDLRWLAATLRGGATIAIGQVAAATGLGGIGKTNLATEFAHCYGQFFAGGVFWLSFADPAGVPAEVAACGAALLDRPGFADLTLDEQVRRVQAAWQEPIPRLLIFDNCDETAPGQAEALLRTWQPTSGGCHVLITSRRANWSRSLGIAALPLGVLNRAESIALLGKHRPDLAADDPALDAIAAELGDLPLALHLAGSFLETYQHSPTFGDPADFLAELRDQRLLGHDAFTGVDVTPSPTNHELHVARSFALSYNRLEPNDPVDALAIQVLARTAALAPGEPIPRDLLLATLALAADDRRGQRQAEKALSRLVGLGLLDQEQIDSLVLHRLLYAFIGEVTEDLEAQRAVEEVLITESYQLNQTGYPSTMQPIIAHLRYATEVARQREDDRAANLCNELGYHLQMIGNYADAYLYYKLSLAIREKIFGPDHPDIIISINNLGMSLQEQGKFAEARRYLEQAVTISEQAFGADHPDVATNIDNLGALHYAEGDLEGARLYLERALAIRERSLGASHL